MSVCTPERKKTNGLTPSPPVHNRTLIRRVSVDLTGLPPSPDEVAAFLSDKSPNAYRKLVDRLLASPAYGERWGRHWLDVVRYGESHGYEQNHLRPNAWPYRDYVIRSFNEDKPFDQFVKEQLAGDLVGKGDAKVEVATGFLVAGVHDTVGNQAEQGRRQQRANDLEDIVSTVGETFLALTVGCAKCHEHKFDPITQEDYYRLAAVFAGVRHGERSIGAEPQTPAEKRQIGRDQNRLRKLISEINKLRGEALAALRKSAPGGGSRPAVRPQENEERFEAVKARFVRFTILATNDGAQPCLDELQVFGPGGDQNIALASVGGKATASSLLPGFPIHQIAHLNDGRYGNSWSWISNERGKGWAQIELPRAVDVNRVVWGRDAGPKPRYRDRLATEYRLEVSLDGKSWKTVATHEGRATSRARLTVTQFRNALPEAKRKRFDAISAERQELTKKLQALASRGKVYAGLFSEPDKIYILQRGDVMQRLEEVTPGALSQLPGYDGKLAWTPGSPEPQRRLALAEWLVNPANPLTARVIVNRVWHYHFGTGIVGTPSDFGHNGERPTHPELLDWLASDFIANGWRLKRLHRMLVTSYAYQQSTTPTAAGRQIDAGNRLLWRMPLRRLEGEAIRDAILLTSGKLDRKMGGPSYLLFDYQVMNVAIYGPIKQYGPETWRRTVYRQAARGISEELLTPFDCPDSSQRSPRRPSTTTALQALTLLNGPFIAQQSDFFAERVAREGGKAIPNQVRQAFRLAFGRSPTADESRAATALVTERGLATLCRALMNANEFLYY